MILCDMVVISCQGVNYLTLNDAFIIASGAWVPFSVSYGSLSSSVITWENEFTLKPAFLSFLQKELRQIVYDHPPPLALSLPQSLPMSFCNCPVTYQYLWTLRIFYSYTSLSPIIWTYYYLPHVFILILLYFLSTVTKQTALKLSG